MRRFLLLVVSTVFASTGLIGQISVSYANFSAMFATGGPIRFYTDTVHTGTINVGHTGGPQTFDFSGLTLVEFSTDTIRLVPADPLTVGRFDPSAITFTIGQNEPKYDQPVLVLQSSAMTQVGRIRHFGTDSIEVSHSSPGEPFMSFPVAMGDSVEVTGTRIDSTFVSSSFSSTRSNAFDQTLVVDGYGTLLLPGGRSYACLRMRSVEAQPSNGKDIRFVTQSGGMLFISTYNTEPDTGFVTMQDQPQYIVNPTVTAVARTVVVPTAMNLDQGYPNPFNPSTVIGYELPERSTVRLSIIDILGREVAVLVNGETGAGFHSVTWDASIQPSGVYFSRLETGATVQIRKLVLIK